MMKHTMSTNYYKPVETIVHKLFFMPYYEDVFRTPTIPKTVFLSRNNTGFSSTTMSSGINSQQSSQEISDVSLNEETIEVLLHNSTAEDIIQFNVKEPVNDTTMSLVKYVTGHKIWPKVKFCPDTVLNSVHNDGVKDSIMHKVMAHMNIQHDDKKRNALFWNTYANVVKKTIQDKRGHTVFSTKRNLGLSSSDQSDASTSTTSTSGNSDRENQDDISMQSQQLDKDTAKRFLEFAKDTTKFPEKVYDNAEMHQLLVDNCIQFNLLGMEWKRHRCDKVWTDVLSEEDEAFGLLIMENYAERWYDVLTGKEEDVAKAKYNDRTTIGSLSKEKKVEGWNLEGLERFIQLLIWVRKRRRSMSVDVRNIMRNMMTGYKTEMDGGGYNRETRTEDVETVMKRQKLMKCMEAIMCGMTEEIYQDSNNNEDEDEISNPSSVDDAERNNEGLENSGIADDIICEPV